MGMDLDKLHEENAEFVRIRVSLLKEETNLSEREAQAVACKTVGTTAKKTAEIMGVKESTVNEYLDRAREKATVGYETYDALRAFGVVESQE